MTTENNFQDTPEHSAGNTSSIGGLWPPEPGSFRRTKAIYNLGTINSLDEMSRLVTVFSNNRMRLSEQSFVETENVPPTRIQFRAVVEAHIMRQCSEVSLMQDRVEAIVPLDSGRFGHEPLLVYFAKNSLLRQPDEIDLHTIKENIEEAAFLNRRPLPEIVGKVGLNGYSLEILSERSENVILQLAQLYERFGWSLGDVRKIVMNQNNVFCVAKEGERIVSSGIAETAQTPFAGSTFNIVEITEAATLDGHGGKGLYTAVSASLLTYLAHTSFGGGENNEIDLVFGECNALSLAVLKAAKIQGRIFATETGSQYGYPRSGILKQQVPISGPSKATEFNDLVPAFLTREKLYEYYL